MQSPGRKQSFPVIWSQSCSDLLKGTGGPPWSTESEHYPPSTHTSMHAGLETGQFTTVWNIILCVCYLMHQIFELRQDAQSLFASWVAAVELLQQTPHYLHMQETSFDWSSKRFTVTAHVTIIREIQEHWCTWTSVSSSRSSWAMSFFNSSIVRNLEATES